MERTFTHDNEVFQGFDRNLKDAQRIAVVHEEVWAVDNCHAIPELKRYYLSLGFPIEDITIYGYIQKARG